jgi:glycine cleavage system H protein
MSTILAVLTLVILFSVELLRRSRSDQKKVKQERILEHPVLFEVSDRLFHPGHSWALVSGNRNVVIGVDDFSSTAVGTITEIDLPEVGALIRQGEVFMILHRNNRVLPQVSPVSGKVVEVNTKLKKQSQLICESPLEQGWVAKVLASNLDTEVRNLLRGINADAWRDAVRAKLIHLLSPNIGFVLQDGGQLVRNLGDNLTEEEWNRLVREFFPTVLPNEFQNNQMN